MSYVFCHPLTVWRAGGTWNASDTVVLGNDWLAGVDRIPANDETQGHGGRLVLRRGYRCQVSDAIADELREAGYGAHLRKLDPPAPPVEREHNVPAVWATMGQAAAIAAMEGRHAADLARLEARIATLEARQMTEAW